MGLFEVLGHLPSLLRLRGAIRRRVIDWRPDVFVGVDSPEFNLGLARRLRTAGLRTVQYVSPQVWAWRQGRVHGIARAVDLVLCLLPFEASFYAQAPVRTEFVGHPLADQIPLVPDRSGARRQLGLQEQGGVIAVLPGSRMSEVTRLADPFAGAMAWLAARRPGLQFVAPMTSARAHSEFERAVRECAPQADVRIVDGPAHAALAAADGALVASGTATLETLLHKRPMVVAYRLNPLTSALVRSFGIMKAPFFSQPNLLAGRQVVPELFQKAVTPEALGAALLAQLEDPQRRAALEKIFTGIHDSLRRGASARAADAILALLEHKA
jgi:lipid-A-disaccharide synthase